MHPLFQNSTYIIYENLKIYKNITFSKQGLLTGPIVCTFKHKHQPNSLLLALRSERLENGGSVGIATESTSGIYHIKYTYMYNRD